MEKIVGVLAVTFAFVVAMAFSGCSFGVQIGYHGKTGLDNEQVSPEFRVPTEKRKY